MNVQTVDREQQTRLDRAWLRDAIEQRIDDWRALTIYDDLLADLERARQDRDKARAAWRYGF